MLISRVIIKNFRQFYGEQTICFSTDKNKNVTLIHAENGVGKTALLNAILWCLFEEHTSNFQHPKALINNEHRDEGKKSYSVAIEFEENNKLYHIVRTVNSANGLSLKLFDITDGDYKVLNDASLFINSVIPKDMAKYFFFQGEGIGAMAAAKGGVQVKKAVKEILGFTVAQLALDDLLKVKKEYRKSLSQSDKSGEAKSIQNEIIELEERIATNEKRLVDTNESIEQYTAEVAHLNEQFINSNSEVIKSKHKERTNVSNMLKNAEFRLSRANTEKGELISEFSVAAFCHSLTKIGLDFIDEEEMKGTIPAPYNEQLVKDLMEAEECICGNSIKIGTEAHSKIKSLLKKASDPHLLNRVNKSRAQLTAIKSISKKAKNSFVRNRELISTSQDEINKLKKMEEELSLAIKGVESLENIEKLEVRRSRSMDKLRASERAVGGMSLRLTEDKASLNKSKVRMSSLDGFGKGMNKFEKLVEHTEKVEKVIVDTLRAAENDLEKELIKKVNNFIEKFSRKDYSAKLISGTYEIKMFDHTDSVVAMSDGEALLLSLTFISSLIELARDRKNAKGQILTPGAIAPFIIDAPFGVLDNKYKGDIAKAIPESVGQVVLLLSSSHWEGAVEESIRNKIGAEYNMVADVTSDGKNKSEDSINVLGKNYETVRYSMGVNCTKIEEVGRYV